MAEKTCPSLPQIPGVDWQNIRTKCPCCGMAMKVVLNWKPEGLELDLVPEAQVDQNLQQHQQSPHQANSSLMNIVSMSADNRVIDHQTSQSSNEQQSGSMGDGNLDEDIHEPGADDSNSSSLSSDSQSQNVSAASNKQLQSTVTPADMMEQSLHTQSQVQVCGPVAVGGVGRAFPGLMQVFQPFHVAQSDGSFKCQFEG